MKLVGGAEHPLLVFYDYLEENDIEVKKLVFFTDGYPCDGWQEDRHMYDDTLFIIHVDNMSEDNAPKPDGKNPLYAYYDRSTPGG